MLSVVNGVRLGDRYPYKVTHLMPHSAISRLMTNGRTHEVKNAPFKLSYTYISHSLPASTTNCISNRIGHRLLRQCLQFAHTFR